MSIKLEPQIRGPQMLQQYSGSIKSKTMPPEKKYDHITPILKRSSLAA